jgi:hypothetical protein
LSLGWDAYVASARGISDIAAHVGRLHHPAARYLNYLRVSGAPSKQRTAPWPRSRRDAAMERGAHQSAKLHREFLYEEMADMVDKAQWVVLPYSLVDHYPQLRISPIGVVPQHERRPRTIVDYTYSGLNTDTVPLCAPEAMQFGRALLRVLQRIVQADPRHGPVHLIKVDVADGFYRISLNTGDVIKMGVAMPDSPSGEPLVAFPLALPMGWVNSPSLFVAATETITDNTNAALARREIPGPHRLEALADPDPPENRRTLPVPGASTPTPPRRPPLQYTDVYVDDFVMAAQGSHAKLRRHRRTLFHEIDKVLRPLEPTDSPHRTEPTSVKKLGKGDAQWSTRKNILGWTVDTVQHTIELPPRRQARLHAILSELPRTQRRTSTKKWHKVMGELRSMELAVPGLRGMFSLLQEAFRHSDGGRIPLTDGVHDALDDIRHVATDLTERPTHLREVIPQAPTILGACDAAKSGMGGVVFDATRQPILWRAPFPTDIQSDIVATNNPGGSITNSDLELAGTIAQHDVAAQLGDVRHRTIGTLTDNTPALAWQRKGSTTTTGPAAYLLRCQALHQRHHRYQKTLEHIPGTANAMADDCSRLWQLTDGALLTHFDAHYPQETPWQMRPLRPAMLSALTSSLRKHRPAPESFLTPSAGPTAPGPCGHHIAPPWPSTRSSTTSTTPSPSSKCTPYESATAGTAAAAAPSALARLIPSFATWARRWPSWGPVTLA